MQQPQKKVTPFRNICVNLYTISLFLLSIYSIIPLSFCWTNSYPDRTLTASVDGRAKVVFLDVMGNRDGDVDDFYTNAPPAKPKLSLYSKSNEMKETVVHFCFLVHGWMGNPSELGYLQSAMEKEKEKEAGTTQHNSAKLITHSVSCNNEKTFDGVAAGGKRVANEVHEIITKYRHGIAGENVTDFTVSFIGNSLGGLYARYAISELDAQKENPPAATPQIHFNVFCTTATPHLGVSKHTYVSIPRIAETAIANIMGETGRDLFRSNDLLRQMAMDQKYTGPLGSFRRRIAYANAFGTDFQVPTCTAAFICRDCDNLHHVKETEIDASNGIFLARFQTESSSSQYVGSEFEGGQSGGDVHEMASRLDHLGWTKVFVDTRDVLPIKSLKIPFSSDKRKDFLKIQSSKKYLKSRELVSLFNSSDRISIPLGHTVMVANSKSNFFSYVNRNGRPIMDYLAREVVAEIMKW